MKTGVIWKNVGETPLQALRRFRMHAVLPEDVPLSYSGRLDPMAEGKILILVGDECKNEKEYRKMDKEYQVEILLGVKTDTGDVLGIPHIEPSIPEIQTQDIKRIFKNSKGVHEWPYPHYSSKPVHGKPLHTWAREGKLHEIELPKTTSRIVSLHLIDYKRIQPHLLERRILQKIKTLEGYNGGKPCGDFRQVEIERAWKQQFTNEITSDFVIINCICIAGSGTYMRTLAEHIGKELGTTACAFSITRKRIGTYRSVLGIHFWYPSW